MTILKEICFVWILCLGLIYSYEDSLVIVNKYDGDKYYCITNSSSGLSWIVDETMSATSINKESSFIPKPKVNFNLKFNSWEQRKVISKDFILDRRWEKLKVHKTDFELKLLTDNIKGKEHFVIPFSIRSKFEAHIFLCDGNIPNKSNCYCFGLKKCILPNGKIDNYETLRLQNQYLSNTEWRHFKIMKENLELSICNVDNKKIISFVDKTPLNISHMLVMNVGLWKLHEIEDFYTKKFNNSIIIENQNASGTLCISLIAKMCENCTIRMHIDNGKNILEAKDSMLPGQNSKWKELIFAKDIPFKNINKLDLTTYNKNAVANNFYYWRISDIVACHKSGYRMIDLDKGAKCQLISTSNYTITPNEKILNQTNGTKCPENTIGQQCIPCSWFVGKDCGRLKFCEKYRKETKCGCSAGYETHDGYECSDQKFCIDCSCINGTCNGCRQNYIGRDDVGIITTKIRNKSVELIWGKPKQSNKKSVTYVVKYRIIQFTGCSKKEEFNFTTKTTKYNCIILPDILPFAEYEFSVYPRTSQHDGTPLKITKKFGQSDQIDDSEFPIVQLENVKSRSVSLKIIFDCTKQRGLLNATLEINCNHKWCNKNIKANIKNPETVLNFTTGIYPFSNYSVNITLCRVENNCRKMQNVSFFQTKSESPRTVRNLIVYSKNSSSISLRWEAPYPPSGILETFCVSYYKESYRNMINNSIISNNKCVLWPDYHCHTLTNLTENITYTIDIKAKNKLTDILGQEISIKAVTKIEPSDKPDNLSISWTLENDLIIRWNHPSKANGNIKSFNITLLTIETLGKNKTFQLKTDSESDYKNTYNFVVKARNLSPLSRYNISVAAFNGLNGKIAFVIDSSPPEIPIFEEEPKIEIFTNEIMKITISNIKNFNSNHSYHLVIFPLSDKLKPSFRSEETKSQLNVIEELLKLGKGLNCSLLKNTNRTILISKMKNSDFNVTQPLNSLSTIVLLLINDDGNKISYKLYTYDILKPENRASINLIYLSLISFLLLPILIFLIKRRRNKVEYSKNKTGNINPDKVSLIINQSSENSKKVKLSEFKYYFEQSVRSGELKNQHEAIIQSIPLYEKYRDNLNVEYVNMEMLNIKNSYVATEVPNSRNVGEFWLFVWLNKIQNIILFDDSKEEFNNKAYWPDMGVNVMFPCKLELKFQSYKTNGCYKIRTLILEQEDMQMQVQQYHFFMKTINRIYVSSLDYVCFFQDILKIPSTSNSPLLIHSSSGMSKVGFVLLCDYSLRMLTMKNEVDVKEVLQKLMQISSDFMVDYNSYLAAHVIIADASFHYNNVHENLNSNYSTLLNSQNVQLKIKYLQDTSWMDKINFKIDKELEENLYYYIPNRDFVVTKIDGFKSNQTFLLSSQPTIGNISEFLDLMIENNSFLILSLSYTSLWPDEIRPILNLEDTVLKYKSSQQLRSCDYITMELIKKKTVRIVEVYSMINQANKKECLPNVSDFIDFCKETNHAVNKSTSAMITGGNGNPTPILYIIMYYVINKLKTEEICDICFCVRTIRRYFKDIDFDENQYQFLTEATQMYMKEFNLYEVS